MADFDFAYQKFCPVEVNGSPRVRNLALPPILKCKQREPPRGGSFAFKKTPMFQGVFRIPAKQEASLLLVLNAAISPYSLLSL